MKIHLEPGEFAHFSEYDMVKALLGIEKAPLGRAGLMRLLGLGEGSTRSLMTKLQELELAKSSTKGIVLTESGLALANSVKQAVSASSKVSFQDESVAIKVKNTANKLKRGLEQRDAAVKAGADGTLILVRGKTSLRIAGSKGFREKNAQLFNEIEQKLHPEDGDAVILAFAKNQKIAERSAWAAAKTLL